jgi:hypothetical protein
MQGVGWCMLALQWRHKNHQPCSVMTRRIDIVDRLPASQRAPPATNSAPSKSLFLWRDYDIFSPIGRYCRHTRLEKVFLLSFIQFFFLFLFFLFSFNSLLHSRLPAPPTFSTLWPPTPLPLSLPFPFSSWALFLYAVAFRFRATTKYVDMLQVIGWRFIPRRHGTREKRLRTPSGVKWTQWIVTQLFLSIYLSNLPLFVLTAKQNVKEYKNKREVTKL